MEIQKNNHPGNFLLQLRNSAGTRFQPGNSQLAACGPNCNRNDKIGGFGDYINRHEQGPIFVLDAAAAIYY